MAFYAPKTQKALNNQGFEYGGSVEIRTQKNGESWAEGLDFCGLEGALVSVFVPRVFPRRVCTSPCQVLPHRESPFKVDPSKKGNFGN
ncbi:hypothetical protein [Pseudomonas sp. NPDC096925]|uniref:hypothetical protein n=1 Tax=Pseudomonas sp. NPDC096925 TaxID=3364484 RepID=UPI00383AFB3E